MKAGIYTVDELAYRCSDFSEHVDKVIEQVNLNNAVTFDNNQLDSTMVFLAMIEDDSDKVNSILTSLSAHTPLSHDNAALIDEKLKELAEEAVRSYEGKYSV